MVCTGIIFYSILYKLETRNANTVKRLVIGAPGIINGYSFCAQVIKRHKPFCKNGAFCR